jgi:hypothetical protein
MKKVIIALSSIVVLASCGGSLTKTKTSNSDSTSTTISTAATTQKQEALDTLQHLVFKDIPISGNLSSFVNKMKKEGFTLGEQKENGALMKGTFVGNENCEILIIATSKAKTVWKVIIFLPEETSWYSIKSAYNNYKEQYIKKYGNPSKTYAFFAKPYYEGDGYETSAVKNDKCIYATFWDTENGSISVAISKYMQVKIVYEDKINSDIDDKEKETNIQGDI